MNWMIARRTRPAPEATSQSSMPSSQRVETASVDPAMACHARASGTSQISQPASAMAAASWVSSPYMKNRASKPPTARIAAGRTRSTAALAHPLEREPPLDDVPDHRGDQLGPARRDDDAAADLLDEPHRLAVGVRGDEHRSPDREDPVETARHDVAREPARETDVVEI